MNLAELVTTAAEDAAEKIPCNLPDNARGLTLNTERPEAPLIVSGDHDLLGAALRNLVDNAMRYTPENGTICIAARTEHGQPLFEVRDSGSGVPRPNCRDWSSVSIAAATSLSKAVALTWRSCVASANCTGPGWKSRTSLAAASQHGCAGAETARRGRFKPRSDSSGTMRCFDTLRHVTVTR